MPLDSRLVRELFAGPLDIVGDVHGEWDALGALTKHLGYDACGRHPDGRHLVFLGDLTDRGPDSPRVVRFVRDLVESQRGQCVLGNHDLNILLDHRKTENVWFYGEDFLASDGVVIPQRHADESLRAEIRQFFATLPLVLIRDDLRIVHAGWDDAMVEAASTAADVPTLYEHHRLRIAAEFEQRPEVDLIGQNLEHQNRNPVKRITSGPEERADDAELAVARAEGKPIRTERRVPWWHSYTGDAYCVFGHYSLPLDTNHATQNTCCIDYGIGKRWTERREVTFDGTFRRTKLAALRFPERQVVFDDGTGPKLVP